MLISLRDACLDFGGPSVLDNVNFQLVKNQRIALLGRNGCGKSSLLKVLAERLSLDSGVIEKGSNIRLGYLGQTVPQELPPTVYDIVAQALQNGQLGKEEWDINYRVEKILSIFKLNGDDEFSALSGGRQRRVLLASVVVTEPEVLLLDEPTNHLDIESVVWLESYLVARHGALLFVSHDREFIARLATGIVELDRGRLHQYDVSYKKYLELQEKRDKEEQRQDALFDKKLAQEERWIRQGIQARRTRNEGRVRALKALRKERIARREKQSVANMRLQSSEKSGHIVAEIEDIHFSFPDQTIVEGLTTTVMRGDKVGLIGPNGVGKSTLLRLLLDDLKPQSGGCQTRNKARGRIP